jgi:small subunit ribosomal protein S21
LNTERGAAKGSPAAAGAPPEGNILLLVDSSAHEGARLADVKECDWSFMQIIVRDNNVEQALRALKKKLQREGVYREMKLRRHYEKPSEKRARERAAAIRRARKLERKRAEREGAR